MKKALTIILTLILFCQYTMAGDYSYLYIEGDKQTPFYVKLEGQMMPRLGKNYCILPNLDAGDIHISILFQQNIYPAQKFVIYIPESSNRCLVLQKVNDKQYALKDLATNNLILAGNKVDSSYIISHTDTVTNTPEISSITNTAPIDTPITSTTQEVVQNNRQVVNANELIIPPFEPRNKSKHRKRNKDKNNTDVVDSNNQFLSGIELNNHNNKNKKNTQQTTDNNGDATSGSSGEVVNNYTNATNDTTVFKPSNNQSISNDNNVAIPNADCLTAMSNSEFENIAISFLDKDNEESKLRYMKKTGIQYCYTTEQVRILAKNLDTQSGKYELVTTLYKKVTDQDHYAELADLFQSSYLKDKFLQSLQAK